MKNQFFILFILFGIITTKFFGQTDSILTIRPHFLNEIETGKRPHVRQIKKIGTYRIERKLNRFEHRPFSFKSYLIGNEIEIISERDFFDFSNKISLIRVKYPIKAVTDKGIILGVSTVEDVIEKYGKPDSHVVNTLYYESTDGRFMVLSFWYGDIDLNKSQNLNIDIVKYGLNRKIIAIDIH